MDFADRQSPLVFEEKTFDETTVFINENGSPSKRRKRKSIGRRVSFAEEPKLHIFPRDDEYETPTRASANAPAASPGSDGKRRSPRLAAMVVDPDKENRVLNSASNRGRRRGASKPLSARDEGSPALKPKNWLDERDASSQAGNDEENTGPVDLRHLSFNKNESEMDEENLTLDSTTFALKFSLQRTQSGQVTIVQPDQNSAALGVVDAFPDEGEVLQGVLVNDMSFTTIRPLLPKLPVSEGEEEAVEMTRDRDMTRDMSLTMQAPKGNHNSFLLASENKSLEENSMPSSDEKIPASGKSSLPCNVNLASVINSQNSPVPVPQAVEVLAQIEERFGSPSGGELKVTIGSDVLAQLEARFRPGLVDEIDAISSDQRISDTWNSSLLGGRDDENSPSVINSRDVENSPVPIANSVGVRAELDARFGAGSVDDEIDAISGDHKISATRNSLLLGSRDDKNFPSVIISRDVENSPMPTANSVDVRAELQATLGSGFVRDEIKEGSEIDLDATGSEDMSDSPMSVSSMELEDRTMTPGLPSLRHLVGKEEDEEMRILSMDHEDRSITMGIPSLRHLIREEEDEEMRMAVDASQGARDTLNPTEDAKTMFTEAEATGTDIPPEIVDGKSTIMELMKWARGALNQMEDAEMMLTEAESTGLDSAPKDVDLRSTCISLSVLPRASETLNPAEEEAIMSREAKITRADSPLKHLDANSTGMSSPELQRSRETINPAEKAELMLTEGEIPGADCPPKQLDVRLTGLGIPEQTATEMQRPRETINPAEEAGMMLTKGDFTGPHSSLKDVDEASTDMSFSELHTEREMQRAVATANPAEEAEPEFTGTDGLPKNVGVRSPDVDLTGLQGAKDMQSAGELNPAEEAKMMLTEAEFTGPDSPPKNVDMVRSSDIGLPEFQKAGETAWARETLNLAEEAKMMLTEAEFTVADSPPKNVDVRSTDTGPPVLQKVMELQRARETLNPAEEAQMMLDAESTGAGSPPNDVSARSIDMDSIPLVSARETQSPPSDSKADTVKHTEGKTRHPHAELDPTDLQTAEELRGPPNQRETSLERIEVPTPRETNNLRTNADVTVKDVLSRERETQNGEDAHCSPKVADTIKEEVAPRKMLGGEQLQSSAETGDDAEVRRKNEAMGTSSRPQDAGTSAVDLQAVERAQKSPSQSSPQVARKRMPIAAFQGQDEAGKWVSPAIINSGLVGPNFDNRATKRTKFLTDTSSEDGREPDNNPTSSHENTYVAVGKGWMAPDNHFSPTLEGVTAQVPGFRDLLAADMNSAHFTPVRVLRRSMWMTPPASVTASRAYDECDGVVVSHRGREDDDDPFDSSMDIVEPTANPVRHSLLKPAIGHSLLKPPVRQATDESLETSDGQVPESFVAWKEADVPIRTTETKKGVEPITSRKENMHSGFLPKASDEKENMGGPIGSSVRQRVTQLLTTKAEDTEQDRPAIKDLLDEILCSSFGANTSVLDALQRSETTDPTHIDRTSREKQNCQSTLTRASGGRNTAPETTTHDDDFIPDTTHKRESKDRTQIVRAPRQKEVEPESLPNRRQSVALEMTDNQENDDQRKSLATNVVVDRTQILSKAQANEGQKGVLVNRNQRVESPEKNYGHGNDRVMKETVDRPQVISTGLEDELLTPSSPRPTRSATHLSRPSHFDKNTFEMNDFHKLGDENVTYRYGDKVQAGKGDSITASNMSVEEFFQLAQVPFAHALHNGLQRARDALADLSFHDVRSLSECFQFVCIVKPQLKFMQGACNVLYEEVQTKSTNLTNLEERLTASNPPIFSYFQNAPEWKRLRIRKYLERLQGHCRFLAQRKRVHFQLGLETEYRSIILESKYEIMGWVQSVSEERDAFQTKCNLPLRRLQANLSSREANQECTSTSAPRVRTVLLEMLEVLEERLQDLKSSKDLKLTKLRSRTQAAEDNLRGLRQELESRKRNLSGLRNQVVDLVCSGNRNLQREEVACRPNFYVKKMRAQLYLSDMLQDGFRVKSAGTENQDPVLELSYLSLLKRRYVVRKVGTVVKVLKSSWVLEPEKIEERFPRLNALFVFSMVLTTTQEVGGISKATAKRSTALTQSFGRLSALEAVRFTLSSAGGGLPEPTSLRASMQVTRILVGNLMDLMEEVERCQFVVNTSAGGGVVVEPRFRNAPDGQLQLETKFIDCVSSIKFFLYLDMSCLPLTGYPFGDLPAQVEVSFCAPKARQHFKRQSLQDSISLVTPGYQRLLRTWAAVGAFLASVRRGV